MNSRDEIIALVEASGYKLPELGHYLVVRDDVDLAREALLALASPAMEWTTPEGFPFRRPLTPEQDVERVAAITAEVDRRDEQLVAAGRSPLPAALGAYLRIRGLSAARAREACDALTTSGAWTSPDGQRFVTR